MKTFETYLLERNEDGHKDIQDKVFGKKWSELKKEKSKASDPAYHLPGVGRFKDEAQARKAFPDHERFKESMDDICRCCGQTPCNCTHLEEGKLKNLAIGLMAAATIGGAGAGIHHLHVQGKLDQAHHQKISQALHDTGDHEGAKHLENLHAAAKKLHPKVETQFVNNKPQTTVVMRPDSKAVKAYKDHKDHLASKLHIERPTSVSEATDILNEVKKSTVTGQRGYTPPNRAVKTKTNTAVRKSANRAIAKDQAKIAANKASRGLRYNWDATKTASMKAALASRKRMQAHIKGK